MTTIVYRDGILAWDSQWTEDGGNFFYRNRKGWKDEEAGMIVAGAGSPAVMYDVLGRVLSDEAPEIRREKDEETDVVILWRDGRLEVYDHLGRCVPHDPANFYAWGSGAAPALAALHMGATAAGAVNVAAKVDIYTCAPVQEESW